MSISIKSKKDIEKMKIAGRKAASVLEMLDDHVKPGLNGCWPKLNCNLACPEYPIIV